MSEALSSQDWHHFSRPWLHRLPFTLCISSNSWVMLCFCCYSKSKLQQGPKQNDASVVKEGSGSKGASPASRELAARREPRTKCKHPAVPYWPKELQDPHPLLPYTPDPNKQEKAGFSPSVFVFWIKPRTARRREEHIFITYFLHSSPF